MAASREQRSLFGEILDWMLAPLLLLWPMSVALTWLVAQSIANRPYDRELGNLALALATQVRAELLHPEWPANVVRDDLTRKATAMLRADDEDRVFFQVLGTRGEFMAGDTALPVPLANAKSAPNELRFRDDEIGGDSVRVAYLWLPGPGAAAELGPLVQFAETLDKRSQLATEIIKGVILPQFVILPLAVLLVWFALSRGIRPLSELQVRIRQRESNDLSPIEESDVPEEVAPLVSAINDLLQRLDQSIAAQRHFLADAAHQLKTPLAGLRTQAELAEREIDSGHGDPASMKHSLRQIALSSQRAAHMVNQLLAMARAEDQEQALRQQPVNLTEVVKETVRDFVPKAMENRIDLGYEGPADDDVAPLPGQPVLLRELVRNLVDNALQYTPAGGTVTARLITDPLGHFVELQVEDNGPGIAAAERELVFRPFYRALGTEVDGSGLGLAIVSEIATHHGAEIRVDDAGPARPGSGPGARFTVRFPRSQAVGVANP
jgi:two-component system, OmpR family, sensor histidine kinase TctE